jgi:uncharacterized protein with GYD domain
VLAVPVIVPQNDFLATAIDLDRDGQFFPHGFSFVRRSPSGLSARNPENFNAIRGFLIPVEPVTAGAQFRVDEGDIIRTSSPAPVNPPARLSRRKGEEMALYILLSTLTDEGRKTVKSKPERIKEVNKEIEGMGAKVLGQYAVLGMYDFVNVVEAPNNETMAKISVGLGARGTIQIMTLPAMPIDQFIKTLK